MQTSASSKKRKRPASDAGNVQSKREPLSSVNGAGAINGQESATMSGGATNSESNDAVTTTTPAYPDPDPITSQTNNHFAPVSDSFRQHLQQATAAAAAASSPSNLNSNPGTVSSADMSSTAVAALTAHMGYPSTTHAQPAPDPTTLGNQGAGGLSFVNSATSGTAGTDSDRNMQLDSSFDMGDPSGGGGGGGGGPGGHGQGVHASPYGIVTPYTPGHGGPNGGGAGGGSGGDGTPGQQQHHHHHHQQQPGGGESHASPGGPGGSPSTPGAGGSGKPLVGTEEWHRVRRDNHKEVERRRRETINEGINELAKIIPGTEKNKGSILARAVKYINTLKGREEAGVEKKTLEKVVLEQAVTELQAINTDLQDKYRAVSSDLETYKRRYGPLPVGESAVVATGGGGGGGSGGVTAGGDFGPATTSTTGGAEADLGVGIGLEGVGVGVGAGSDGNEHGDVDEDEDDDEAQADLDP